MNRLDHQLFKEKDFYEACKSVVGTCNNVSFEDRWEKETPDFTRAILERVTVEKPRILDYGCGVGRMAKEVLDQSSEVTVVGVDASAVQLQHAREYINNSRFSAMFPHELEGQFDLVYCLYVLQHIPAIEIREAIARMHYRLKSDGLFIYCSSDARMAVRWDDITFFDDRFLGVNLRAEVEKLFEPVEDLFTPDVFERNDTLRRIILGFDGRTNPTPEGAYGTAHPAIVYRPRKLVRPYFDMTPRTSS
jgi:SAM-dependent methyltransferase